MTSTADFYLKANDTRPYLAAALSDRNGVIDLAGATVVFSMRHAETGVVQVNRRPCVVTSAIAGSVEYRWGTADTTVAGRYLGEFEAVLVDSTRISFPSDRHLDIKVFDEIA